ncbi:Hypothetical predicted protein [Cloeon dipterum]|uniref:Uncharacterized protein n=1 Tax=Cloeon dipterum TaxID=197152 RepID=A0A8S1CAK7_9INSE|nr:Hypothetical predicted protein [Cloeon dipterum]
MLKIVKTLIIYIINIGELEVSESDNPPVCPRFGEEITDIESRKRKMDNLKKVSQFTSTNKKLRLEGKDYLGISIDKDTKMTTFVLRGGKTMKPACPPSSKCMKDSSKSAFQCHKLSPEDREGNFNAFWNTKSWPERKAFLLMFAKPA